MGFGLFFVPLIGGYLFLTRCNYTRYLVARETGYRLLFKSAAVGFILSAIAWFIVHILAHYVLFNKIITFFNFPAYTMIVGIAFILGPISAHIINFFCSEWEFVTRYIKTHGDVMERLFLTSMEQDSLVEVTLENGKVYVG